MVLRWVVACAWDYAMHACMQECVRVRASLHEDVCMYVCNVVFEMGWYAGVRVVGSDGYIEAAGRSWLGLPFCVFWC